MKVLIISAFFIFVSGHFNAHAQSTKQKLEITESNMDSKKADAEQMLNTMKSILENGYMMLQDARKSKDISRITCVNDSLTAIKGLVKHSEMNFLNLNEAYMSKNLKAFKESYIKIKVAYDKIKELKGQLLSCGVSETYESTIEGKTEVKTEFDKDLPKIDTDKAIYDLQNYEVEAPVSASPFL